jgi:hypothetical protein
LVDNQPRGEAMIVMQDGEGRDLAATIPADDFDWQLWVNLATKDAVVRQRFKGKHVRRAWNVTIPEKFVDYEHVLQEFVDNQTKK